MTEYGLAVLAGAFVVYALFSRRLSTSSITGPMLFVALGLVIGPKLLGVAELELNSEIVRLLLESTLVLVLFTDAMAIHLRGIRKEAFIPGRLLAIGMPLTIAAGLGVALLLFGELGFWEAAVLATILAPTDAALGHAVVSNPRVPRMIRQGLNVESGLNDGIALPFLLLFLAGAEASLRPGIDVVVAFGQEIVLALIVGVAVGWLGARAIVYATRRDWTTESWRAVAVAALALLAYGVTNPIGGSGFIAAFVAGLVFGRMTRREFSEIGEFAERFGYLLTMLSFLVFGALVLGPRLEMISVQMGVYVALSLTLVRLAPVALSMFRADLRPPTVLYVGWFGPRGLASVIFGAIVLLDSTLPAREFITTVMALAVGISVYAHGVSAWLGSNRYADWYESMSDEHEEMPESTHVTHLGMRQRIVGPGKM